MLSRIVIFAITAGIVCASAVVLVFATGLQIRHAWYALVPFTVGSLVLLVLRLMMPKAEAEEETSL